MRYWIALALALCTVLAAPTAATGTVLTTDAQRLAWFLPTARAQWPDSPCVGKEQVDLGADLSIYSRDDAGVAFPSECRVEISAGLDDYFFCVALTHEFGHLAGYGHNPDPASIMNAYMPTDYKPCTRALPQPPRLTPRESTRRFIAATFGDRVLEIRWLGPSRALVWVGWPGGRRVSQWSCSIDLCK